MYICLQENEFFQENLRTSQRRLLKVTRDRSFLLDRLLQYEKTDLTSSESEDTESSDDSSKMEPTAPTVGRKRKNDASGSNNSSLMKNPPKRRKPGPKKQISQQIQQQAILQQQRQLQAQHQAQIMAQLQAQSQQFQQQHQNVNNNHHQQQQQQPNQEGHLTTEEVERHLQSRAQSMLEVVPEGELPNEMFSQNPSSESNDQMVDTSPSNIGEECLSVDLNMMQQD